MAGDSDEQRQALALLQKEMLAFILEGVTERIERGEAPLLADAVAAAIGKQVETAIDNGLRGLDLPNATRIAEEVVRIGRAEPGAAALSPARSVFDPSPHPYPDAEEGERTESPVRRSAAIWLIPLLLLFLAFAGWFGWQQSGALRDETAARTRIAVERDALSGELCRTADAQQQQLARVRNTAVYKTNCAPQAAGAPDFCQAVDALDKSSRPVAGCSRQ